MKKFSKTKKRKHQKAGNLAEGLACLWLILQGFRIVARRYHPPYPSPAAGEIDIIAKRKNLFIFVEVKFRHQNREEAMFAVTQKQQQRIATSARIFLANQPSQNVMARFDAVFFSYKDLPLYIKNAWQVAA